ncbi:RNA polymerase sigma factor [Aliarcobacter lanthieri]|uniref:RNA polymerase sigma factor n=1 Tax=Arcobacteraceae TaxID=2808963 RepID=UPI000DE848F3|nr:MULTISPECIES: RNA polymerase sigma factor [Arcobacteraceae]MBL3520214.1 RNA polymerase sigma factor [Aliarcobacter lanthieri]RBQ26116.1 RNA polymerase subunit sigma [Arcobacter sp. CECT 9188]
MTIHYNEIFQYVKKNVFDKQTAQDITQETFTRAIKSADRNVIENERALLYRIAKNVMFDLYKEKYKIDKISFEEDYHINESDSIETILIEDEQTILLLQEVEKLPIKRRQAFTLHIIDGYSRDEVASMMNITINAVEKHISRASNQIKENLSKKENNNDK